LKVLKIHTYRCKPLVTAVKGINDSTQGVRKHRGSGSLFVRNRPCLLKFKGREGHAPDGLGGALEAEAELEVEVILVGRGLSAHLLLGRRLWTRSTKWGKRVKIGGKDYVG
jgi:hypothetical protein